jgi:hypothetical protein
MQENGRVFEREAGPPVPWTGSHHALALRCLLICLFGNTHSPE